MNFFARRKATKRLVMLSHHWEYGPKLTAAEVETLIGQGAEVNPSLPESTLLGELAMWDNSDAVGALLRNGANPNITNPGTGWTPLHTAAQNGHNGMIRLLVQHGAHINFQGHDGDTPLFRAVSTDKAIAARTPELLVELGADPAVRDRDGKVALDHFRGTVDVLVGRPPLGKETHASRQEEDRRMLEDLQRLTALFSRSAGGR